MASPAHHTPASPASPSPPAYSPIWSASSTVTHRQATFPSSSLSLSSPCPPRPPPRPYCRPDAEQVEWPRNTGTGAALTSHPPSSFKPNTTLSPASILELDDRLRTTGCAAASWGGPTRALAWVMPTVPLQRRNTEPVQPNGIGDSLHINGHSFASRQ